MSIVVVGPTTPFIHVRLPQGATARIGFVYEIDGVPQSIAGMTALFVVSTGPRGRELFTLDTVDEITIEDPDIDAPTGRIDCFFNVANTTRLRRGGAWYRLTLTGDGPDPDVIPVCQGVVIVDPSPKAI